MPRMVVKKYFSVVLMLCLMGPWVWAEGRVDPKVQQLDRDIRELQEMKRGYEARALRHEDEAERLQFDDQTYLETRRHLQLAAENREKAEEIQKEIDRLQQEKRRLEGS